ncbi:MAG: flavin reductase family protein [Alphaproteobacteria bacterium]|nr:flavin reductase family protein [Alphaproteobacteria bacterium]
MKVDSRTFRKALGCFPTGVAVVTTLDSQGKPVGVTISSFTSVSLEPPLVLFCLANTSGNLADFKASGHFAVNVLREDQRELSMRFAGRGADKWAEVPRTTWETGSPIIGQCLANLDCRVVAVHEGGDHLIFVGEVDRLEYGTAGQPLIYFRGDYAALGNTTLP